MSSLGMSSLKNSLQSNVASVVIGSMSLKLLKRFSLDFNVRLRFEHIILCAVIT